VGCGEDIFLALSEPEDEQRLRASAGELGSLYLGGDEPPYGEEIGPFMRVFRQFQGEVRSAAIAPQEKMPNKTHHRSAFAHVVAATSERSV
jgi:hypothetical protein